jgi:hypothetical protein
MLVTILGSIVLVLRGFPPRNLLRHLQGRLHGFDLVDMRDVATAGVIDNIMRAQIRDAAFILADLTDDNPGALLGSGLCRRARQAGDLPVRVGEV